MKFLNNLFKKKPTVNENQYSTYQLIGGEATARAISKRFYDIMESDPQAKELFAIHKNDMSIIREKFFEFLSGWLGGPALFEQKYGHPRLRARHLPFPVTEQLRDQWMYCMNKALDENIDNKVIRRQISAAFSQLATHMINS
jgi:hemoglobin